MASITTNVKGHVKIQNGMVMQNGILVPDNLTGQILVDKNNAVHNKNMASVIARGLSNTDAVPTGTHQIYAMALGNGGASVNSTNEVAYQPPNVTGAGARLYNQTYLEVVDEQQAGVPASNSVTYQESTIDDTSIVVITATIAAGEPSGQDITDTPPNPNFNSTYTFDELGLFCFGSSGTFSNTDVPADALLLTHIVFSPILKTANRELVITYTLTISVS